MILKYLYSSHYKLRIQIIRRSQDCKLRLQVITRLQDRKITRLKVETTTNDDDHFDDF